MGRSGLVGLTNAHASIGMNLTRLLPRLTETQRSRRVGGHHGSFRLREEYAAQRARSPAGGAQGDDGRPDLDQPGGGLARNLASGELLCRATRQSDRELDGPRDRGLCRQAIPPTVSDGQALLVVVTCSQPTAELTRLVVRCPRRTERDAWMPSSPPLDYKTMPTRSSAPPFERG